MNKKRLFSIVAVTLIVAGTGCNKAGKLSAPSKFTPPTGPVELKLKWTPGERVVQDLDMKTKSDINIPGQPAPMHQDMTMGQKYALTVLKETPDGGHEVEMEFLSARMGVEMGGKTLMNYDSTEKSGEDATNPVADMFGKIIGSKIQFFMDASNNVDRIEGVDDMMNRLSAGGTAAAMAPLKSMFSEGYFKQMMSSSRFMPPHAVAPGDSWPVQLEFPMASLGTLVINYTFTFQGWETHGVRNCARLEFQGDIETKPGSTPSSTGMTVDIQNGTTSGVSWFDPELGITIDTVMNQDMSMNMILPRNPQANPGADSPPKKITSQMNQVLDIKLDSVK
jgi:hypothetical protein